MSKESKESKEDSQLTPLPDHLQLELPDAPGFISTPPSYTLKEMILLCEAMLPYWNKQRFVLNTPRPDPPGEIFKL